MTRGGFKQVLAGLGVVLAVTSPAAPARASACPVPAPVLFSYPSAGATRVPLNAIPLVVPDGLAEVRQFTLNGEWLLPMGDGERFFAPRQLLTPGAHVLELRMRADQNSSAAREDLDVSFEFEVEPFSAPPPDETAWAQITRVVYFEPDQYLSARHRGYLRERERVMEDPLDCSQWVADQTWKSCPEGGRPSPGNTRVEIEAGGDAIGFFINGLFMPGDCRSAFVPSDAELFELQVVTATGAGERVPYSGGIERYVAPELPYPAVGYQDRAPGLWESCGFTPRRRVGSPALLGLALLAVLAVALRRAGSSGY
ncbi:MAG TPA: hypothetical protein VJU61_15910 [Polyangiaceae bacterium]|nr:hypothetical protein [Polyangiaceae bacterium]